VWVGAASSNAIARHLVAQLEGEGASMLFGHHVLAAVHDGAVWRLSARDRATGTTSELAFDALVLSDKLLVLQDGTYSVLASRCRGADTATVLGAGAADGAL
jgi:hypothetical protein